jgi:hypothetical protein
MQSNLVPMMQKCKQHAEKALPAAVFLRQAARLFCPRQRLCNGMFKPGGAYSCPGIYMPAAVYT